ncbi:(Fe-S)-binding protein [Myxococcota bacterium]|nr:(Fe-S)-binding protein [Myxococcota bacterium]MCZ7620728.1 (Fe-S)-binding protein [Myxococcota bacterium]
MRVGLFVPCYVDQLAPQVAEATVEVLERAGCRVDYDPEQTCCGQPFLNLGLAAEARRLARTHLERFALYDAVVCPSSSCVSTVRRSYTGIGVGDDAASRRVRARTFELGEFLVRELGIRDLGARFPHRVALLASCHGLRELGLGRPSEVVGRLPGVPDPGEPGPTEQLLRAVAGLELLLPRRDECCGFGGAFSVELPEVSARMGRSRLAELTATGAEWIVGTDVSCLLHLDGLRRHAARTDPTSPDPGPRILHLAEVLASR